MNKRIFGTVLPLLLGAAILCRAETDTDLASEFLFSEKNEVSGYVTEGEMVHIAVALHRGANGCSDEESALSDGAYAAANGVGCGLSPRSEIPVTRADAAAVLGGALPHGLLEARNRAVTPSDVSDDDPARSAVLSLIAAGITGGGERFYPERPLTRAELDEWLLRIAFPERRIVFAPMPVLRAARQAYELCFTETADASGYGISSGWIADNRGGMLKESDSGYSAVIDVRDDASSGLTRLFNTVTNDLVELRASILVVHGFNGIHFVFADENGGDLLRVFTKDNAFYTGNEEENTLLLQTSGYNAVYEFRFVLDLETRSGRVFINNRDCGVCPLLSDNLRSFTLARDDESRGRFNVNGVYARANAIVWEDLSATTGIPCDMTVSGNVVNENGALRLTEGSSLKRGFEASGGRLAFALNALLPADADAEISLLCGEETVLTMSAAGGGLYCGDTVLCAYSADLWQKLRFEIDTEEQTFRLLNNAKVLYEGEFDDDVPYVDGFRISSHGESAVYIDDLLVFALTESRVPPVVIPDGDDDYMLGINVCSLWRNGENIGWNVITPYSDIKPVLGYYDEGLPETAEWEIKYLAEHGVDFEAFCWFASRADAPMKKTRMSAALDDGYLYASNNDAVDFSLIWEASNGSLPASSDAFRRYYVPYLIENYFSNVHYASVDGRLIFSVFGVDDLINGFANAGMNVKTEFDYLRSTVRMQLGKEMLILGCGVCTNRMAAYGFDGWHTYSWGTEGYSLEVNKSENLSARRNKDVTVIPSVSVGFNSIAWKGTRYPMMSVSDYKSAHEWVRDTYLPTYAARDSLPWNDSLVWLSTWNEFGEGTYLMPSEGLNGFGYLDAIREVYTRGGAHEDAVPDEEQLSRITHLYPQDLVRIAPRGRYTGGNTTGVTLTVNGHTLQNALPGIIDVDGTVYFPFEPHVSMIHNYLYVTYRWEPDPGRLTLSRDGKEYVFTVGSYACRVGSQMIDIVGTVYTMDGVPMLPIKGLAKALGFGCSVGGTHQYYYATPEARIFRYTNDEAARGVWDFARVGDCFGFTSYTSRTSFTEDGLRMEAYHADPSLVSGTLAFDASAYSGVEVVFRCDIATDSAARLYFATSTEPQMSEDKAVSLPVMAEDSGNTVTLFFPTAENAKWQGTVKSLRFDPMACVGNAVISRIRLVPAGEEDETPYRQYLPVQNGDAAEASVTFTSLNASVTRESDEASGAFFRFLPKTGGKLWCYATQRLAFVPGHTYQVDFDVRLVSLGTDLSAAFDDSVNVWCNLQYEGHDHTLTALPVTKADGWRHYRATGTVDPDSVDRSKDIFSVFTVPVGENGIGFDLDNVVIKDITYNH